MSPFFFLALLVQPPDWRHAFDFDGDSAADTVEVDFTGGAHCCYRLAITLSSTGRRHALPVELDGGYVGGLDLSQPDRFAIAVAPGRPAELVMEIETYNGEELPLPRAWVRRFGIRTHLVTVSFPRGRLRVRDAP